MNVTIRDGAGTIVGTGSTGSLTEADVPADDEQFDEMEGSAAAAAFAKLMSRNQCTVVFETTAADADFYSIEVGSRGDLTYSREELDEADWWVELTLGG